MTFPPYYCVTCTPPLFPVLVQREIASLLQHLTFPTLQSICHMATKMPLLTIGAFWYQNLQVSQIPQPSFFSSPSLGGCPGMILLLDFSMCSLLWVEPWAVHRSTGNVWPSVLPETKGWLLLSLNTYLDCWGPVRWRVGWVNTTVFLLFSGNGYKAAISANEVKRKWISTHIPSENNSR